jgi:hypothetical protein
MPDGCPSARSTSAEDLPKPSLTSATVARDSDRTEQHVFEEIVHLSPTPGKSSHERYLPVFKLIEQQDRELADTVDDLRRSTAVRPLALIP